MIVTAKLNDVDRQALLVDNPAGSGDDTAAGGDRRINRDRLCPRAHRRGFLARRAICGAADIWRFSTGGSDESL